MNGVLYGVDTRATAQIAELNAAIGADRILATCGNALTSQSVGPKILWLKQEHPDLFARTAKVLTSTSFITWKLTGTYAIDHYTAANFSPLYDVTRLDWTADLADILPLDRLPRLMWSTDIAATSLPPPPKKPALRKAPRSPAAPSMRRPRLSAWASSIPAR